MCVIVSELKKDKYSFSAFFSGYFNSFSKLLLVNLLFCIPLAIWVGGLFLLNGLLGELSIFLICMLIPLMSPFFGGLVYVCKKLSAGDTIRPFKDYFKGIKDNWLFFAVNSILLYFVSVGLWVVYYFYRGFPQELSVTVYFAFSAVTALIFFLMDSSAIVMAVSVELKFTEIIRNSLLLIVKGFTNHLKTFVALLFVLCLCLSVMMTTGNAVVSLTIMGVLTAAVLPVLVTYIIVFNSYQTIERLVIMPYTTQQNDQHEKKEITLEELEKLIKGDPNEYVYLHGKMIKRSSAVKMYEVKKASSEDA